MSKSAWDHVHDLDDDLGPRYQSNVPTALENLRSFFNRKGWPEDTPLNRAAVELHYITDGDSNWTTSQRRAEKVLAAYRSRDEVSTQEQLDALPAGTMVFYAAYYDGYFAVVAQKDRDGVWRQRDDPQEDGVTVKPWIPCKIVFRPEEDA